MKVLYVGDIVSSPGRSAVEEMLPQIRKENKVDFVIANIENLSGGRGFTIENFKEMQHAGIDFFTSGDHIFWQKESLDEMDNLPLVRPANYPLGTPGKGYEIVDTGKKGNILIINLLGKAGFSGAQMYTNNPFSVVDDILEEVKDKSIKYIFVDFHAETTSEKCALGFYLDGRVSAVVGSHTHVPTCDQRVLPKGTLYITDAGMTGNIDSVLGAEKEIIISLISTAQNQRFEWEKSGLKAFRSVLLDLENKTISRIDKVL